MAQSPQRLSLGQRNDDEAAAHVGGGACNGPLGALAVATVACYEVDFASGIVLGVVVERALTAALVADERGDAERAARGPR